MKLTAIAALKESDLQIPDGPIDGDKLREAFRRLFVDLNPYFDGLNKLAARGLTLTENVACEIAAVQLTHGVPQLVALKTLTKAGGALILSADGQVPYGTCALQMQQQTGAFPLANVTAYFRDTTASKVNCTLLILPEGTQTTSVPAP